MKKENYGIVYCEGAFNTPNGKTAHGLVRFTKRYKILAVLDSKYAGQDAGNILDGKVNEIPVMLSLDQALKYAQDRNIVPDYFIIGLAPDGGRMTPEVKEAVRAAIRANLHIDSGLHDFLTEQSDMIDLAKKHNVILRDIRKPPDRSVLHFFSGKIEEVKSLKVALLGTDSAIGKRTTAWILVNSLNSLGMNTELVGTGQTAWMQGARYSIILDSLINDFVTGEIENAVWDAWHENAPDVIVIEGQGSLLNPAYPGGYEILAAARPDLVILQHAPARKEYDGFPGYKIHDLQKQIHAIEVVSEKPVVAITINHENMTDEEVQKEIRKINKRQRIPAFDVLSHGGDDLSELIISNLKTIKKRTKH